MGAAIAAGFALAACARSSKAATPTAGNWMAAAIAATEAARPHTGRTVTATLTPQPMTIDLGCPLARTLAGCPHARGSSGLVFGWIDARPDVSAPQALHGGYDGGEGLPSWGKQAQAGGESATPPQPPFPRKHYCMHMSR